MMATSILIVNNENQPAFIYKNNSREINKYHYFGAILKGDSSNTLLSEAR